MLLLHKIRYWFYTLVFMGFFFQASCTLREDPILNPILVNGIIPVHGVAGEEITILGKDFKSNLESEFFLKLGDTNIELKEFNDTMLVFQVPDNLAIGTYNLSLTRKEFREYNVLYEIKNNPAPQVLRIYPNNPEIGEIITIYGKNFGLDYRDFGIIFTDIEENPILFSEFESDNPPFTPLIFSSKDSVQVIVPERALGQFIFISVDPTGENKMRFNITTKYR